LDEVPGYTFDQRAMRYRHVPSGQFVSEHDVNEAMQQIIDAQILTLGLLGDRLRIGDIGLHDWQIGMANGIRLIHTLAAALAVGGFIRLDVETIRATEALVAQQLDYLAAFSVQIQIGDQPLNGTFMRRIAMYAEAGLGAAQEIRRGLAIRLGYDEERRVLGEADHCRDCVRAARLGWQPIGTLPRIGASVCKTNCRCRFQFRRTGEP
jgi:hypothetical protein